MASLERGSGPSHQNRNRSIDVIDLTESDGEVAEDNGSDSDETLLGDDLQNFFSTSHLGNTSSRIVPSFSRAGRTFKAGKTAELTDGSFLFITAVMEDHSLSGYLLCRTRRLQGLLEYKRNEVVMLLRYDDTDPRDILQQSVEHVDITDIVKFRQLIRSNKSFPAFSFRETECRPKSGLSKAEIYQREAYIEAHCQLVCRWKFLQINKEYGFLQVLTKKDIDENHYVTPEDLKYNFCGDTVRQGACPGWRPGEEAFVQAERSKYRGVDLLNFNRGPTTSQDDAMDLTNDRRYTFADICCGGGGASRGAQAANLCVYLGLDNNIPAMNTYRLNFPFARFEGIGIHEFVTIVPECKVDIVHVSLPCQPFAHCHARPGQNDEMNQATFVSIEHLLKKLKPRLVIFEETSGLIRINNNKPWFRKTIQDFTRLGFSVRWKVMNFAEFGLPQERKRFILFASW